MDQDKIKAFIGRLGAIAIRRVQARLGVCIGCGGRSIICFYLDFSACLSYPRLDAKQKLSRNETTMTHPCTGVILAGGLNTRFNGKEKAFLEINGIRILDRILNTFKAVFSEIILVTNHPLQYLEWDVHMVSDLIQKRSALTGIHAGLYYCTYSHAFVSAGDTPFLEKALVEALVSDTAPSNDVIIPETSAGFEPLCAVYSKKRVPYIEKLLAEDRFKLQELFTGARVKKVPESRLRESDPTLRSFFNINTPQDLESARAFEKKVSCHGCNDACRSD